MQKNQSPRQIPIIFPNLHFMIVSTAASGNAVEVLVTLFLTDLQSTAEAEPPLAVIRKTSTHALLYNSRGEKRPILNAKEYRSKHSKDMVSDLLQSFIHLSDALSAKRTRLAEKKWLL